jgi:hypothetical protein
MTLAVGLLSRPESPDSAALQPLSKKTGNVFVILLKQGKLGDLNFAKQGNRIWFSIIEKFWDSGTAASVT